MPTVLCCMCSLPIPPNPTSMCVLCIRTQVDITEGIATNLTIHQCRGCKRYLRPPWVEAKLESRELMAVCLRKVGYRLFGSRNVVDGPMLNLPCTNQLVYQLLCLDYAMYAASSPLNNRVILQAGSPLYSLRRPLELVSQHPTLPQPLSALPCPVLSCL